MKTHEKRQKHEKIKNKKITKSQKQNIKINYKITKTKITTKTIKTQKFKNKKHNKQK